MKPAPFAYCRPATLAEALDTLARHADARILAGGQSLMPALNMRLAQPGVLVDINRLPGLDGIHAGPEGLVIGALARHETVLRSPRVAQHAPLIAQAMPHVAHLALRIRGTVGGSLALADPAAELPACAVALDAVLRVARRGGEREVPAAAFFRGQNVAEFVEGHCDQRAGVVGRQDLLDLELRVDREPLAATDFGGGDVLAGVEDEAHWNERQEPVQRAAQEASHLAYDTGGRSGSQREERSR